MRILSLIILLSLVLGSCKTNNNEPAPQAETENEKNYPVQKVSDGTISLEQARKYLESGEYIFIDLRTPEEIEEFGMIEGSMVLNMRDMSFKTKFNELDREKKYVLYCRGGNRSARAYLMSQGMKFKTVYDMTDGYEAWAQEEQINN